jgi:hypothetical protein
MTSHDKQLTANDIKGELAQRLRCPGCTRNFAQVAGRNVLTLDKKETIDGNRRAISVVCDDCKREGRQPAFAFRKFTASDGTTLVLEARVEDLPDLTPSSAKATRTRSVKTRTKRAGRKGRGNRAASSNTKTTPTVTPTDKEGATAAAKPTVTTLE